MQRKRISLSVTSDSPETITRAVEAFGRAAAGMALEDDMPDVFLMISDDSGEDD